MNKNIIFYVYKQHNIFLKLSDIKCLSWCPLHSWLLQFFLPPAFAPMTNQEGLIDGHRNWVTNINPFWIWVRSSAYDLCLCTLVFFWNSPQWEWECDSNTFFSSWDRFCPTGLLDPAVIRVSFHLVVPFWVDIPGIPGFLGGQRRSWYGGEGTGRSRWTGNLGSYVVY